MVSLKCYSSTEKVLDNTKYFIMRLSWSFACMEKFHATRLDICISSQKTTFDWSICSACRIHMLQIRHPVVVYNYPVDGALERERQIYCLWVFVNQFMCINMRGKSNCSIHLTYLILNHVRHSLLLPESSSHSVPLRRIHINWHNETGAIIS